MLYCRFPRIGGFICIGRTNNHNVRYSPDCSEMFNRLMRRPVLTKPYTVVCKYVYRADTGKGAKTYCRTEVIGKNKECCTERNDSTVNCHPVQYTCHPVFTDSIMYIRCFVIIRSQTA